MYTLNIHLFSWSPKLTMFNSPAANPLRVVFTVQSWVALTGPGTPARVLHLEVMGPPSWRPPSCVRGRRWSRTAVWGCPRMIHSLCFQLKQRMKSVISLNRIVSDIHDVMSFKQHWWLRGRQPISRSRHPEWNISTKTACGQQRCFPGCQSVPGSTNKIKHMICTVLSTIFWKNN